MWRFVVVQKCRNQNRSMNQSWIFKC